MNLQGSAELVARDPGLRPRLVAVPPREREAIPFLPAASGSSHRPRALFRLLILLTLTLASNLVCRLRKRLSRRPLEVALRATQRLSRALIRVLGVQVDVAGSPWAGLALYVANHRSYVDVAVLMARKPTVFLAKTEIGEWPVFGAATRLAGTVYVRREDRESRKRALGEIRNHLERGTPVTVFPEGTTSSGPGIQPFRPGVFRVAAELGVAVVPVAIAYGSREDAWVGDDDFVRHFLDRFGNPRMRVAVEFGPPMHGDDAERLKDAAESWILGRLHRMESVR